MIAGLVGDERGLRAATEAVLAGPLAVPFWGVRVGLGLALPLVLIVAPRWRTDRGLFVAAVCALGGVFVDRLLLVTGGEITPITSAAGVVSSPYAAYTPSPVELAIVVGAVAFVAFTYTLAERYLDLGESDVHAGFPVIQLLRRVQRLFVPVITFRSGLDDGPLSASADTEVTGAPESGNEPREQARPVPGGER
jgi:hypothetical protein